jgi:hypothetical protein
MRMTHEGIHSGMLSINVIKMFNVINSTLLMPNLIFGCEAVQWGLWLLTSVIKLSWDQLSSLFCRSVSDEGEKENFYDVHTESAKFQFFAVCLKKKMAINCLF